MHAEYCASELTSSSRLHLGSPAMLVPMHVVPPRQNPSPLTT
jgi:hypothetical protein